MTLDERRWYERGEDGSTCDWGRMLSWEPPTRLVLSWEITADWKHDPNLKTEVEVRFSAAEDGSTTVDLEHRGFEVLGDDGQVTRDGFANGWPSVLASFGRRAAQVA